MEKDIAELFRVHNPYMIALMRKMEQEEELIYSNNLTAADYIYHRGALEVLRELRDEFSEIK